MTGLPASFPVRVCMLSDWIVGTGEGRVGDVDATVRRDHDGLPFIPAKTLTGIWRDACEQVAWWLSASEAAASEGDATERAGAWQAWVDWIFGSQPDAGRADSRARDVRPPQRAQLALSPARLTGPVRAACAGRPALVAAAVVVRPGVAIDDQTGAAADDMLRLEERARPGWLEAQAEFPFLAAGELPAAAEFLLRAGAAAIDSLGGKRNRGAGRCWLLPPGTGERPDGDLPLPAASRPADARLAELAADAALMGDPGLPPAGGPPVVSLAPSASAGRPEATADRVTRRVTLEVITPVVAQHRVLGNVVLTRDWIPGTVLLPVVLSRLDGQVGHRDIAVGDARPAARSDDDVIPGRPTPMVWYREKGRPDGRLVNAALRRPSPAERLRPMRGGHVAQAAGGTWMLLEPELTVSTHAVIGDDSGRPDSDRGGVFSYLGIAPGTLLASDIVLPAGIALRLEAGQRLRLGRSRKDDFGEVRVVHVDPVDAPAPAGLEAGEQVRVWCLSDVLLRDDWGAYDPRPQALAAGLSRHREVSLRAEVQRPGATTAHAYRAARRDSFHTRWNRPRPTLTGLAAGSVITLTATAPVPASALAAIERDGVGERTAEGFGQVRFGAAELSTAEPELRRQVTASAGSTAGGDTAALGPGELLPPAPHILEQAALQNEIARRVAERLTAGIDGVIPGTSQVRSRAQWGSLREQLPLLRSPAGRDAVREWLARTREVRTRRDTWGDSALDAVRTLLTDPTAVWTALGLDDAAMDQFLLAPDRAGTVRAALWPHATSALLTEVARTAVREMQAEQAGQEQP